MSEAALHIWMIFSGFFSDFKRDKAVLDFSLLVNGVVESGFRIDDK